MNKLYLLFSTLLFTLFTIANDNVEAKRLIENSQKKLSLKNVHLRMELETIDKMGQSKSKTLIVSFAEFGEEKKVMIEFVAPDKVSGTKILTTNYPNKKGIIEIYMPSTGKIQKIRANQRNLKIMGSEIPINQFNKIIDAELNFSLLGKEMINGTECHKIKVEKQGSKDYGIAFVSVEKEQLLRVERYNVQDKLQSLTELVDYMEVSNSESKVYPSVVRVKNFKTGKSSNMKVRDVNYLTKVNIEDFKLSSTAS